MSHEGWFLPIYDQPRDIESRGVYVHRKKAASQMCWCSLRCAFQRDDRQVSRPTVEVDFEYESIAGLMVLRGS